MIDLHCHMLPGIDDGAQDWDTAMAMARMAVADGIRVTACTPHIYPGLYDNTGTGIAQAVQEFHLRLEEEGIPLQLTYGADTHLATDLVSGLGSGTIPSLNASRYFLLEPPHYTAPPRLEETVLNLINAGYVPIITHPERLVWITHHYQIFPNLVRLGAWLQVTAGSLTGRFGSSPRYWGEKLLDKGLVHILATDAHSIDNRPPLLGEGRQAAERWVGFEEATRLVETRPRAILDDQDPDQWTKPSGLNHRGGADPRSISSLVKRWLRWD